MFILSFYELKMDLRRGKKVKGLTNSGNTSRLIVHLTDCDAQNNEAKIRKLTLKITDELKENLLRATIKIAVMFIYPRPICLRKLT